MGITVGELVAVPHLRLRIHCGRSGIDREVTWTHTSDLPRPWEWVGPGELLMTNGMSFPAGAAEQADLVRQLVAVGVSGLAIGEQMYCPELTPRFVRTSDELGLPVLWVSYPLPFVSISRAVAEATLLEQSQRLMRTARIYDTLRRTTGAATDQSSIAVALSSELGCAVSICDRETGAAYHPGGPHPAPEVARAASVAASGALVAGARSVVLDNGDEVLVAEIPTHEQAVLVVARPTGLALDGILLQHAATVAALELSQTKLALEHARRSGAETLSQLLDGRADSRTARRHLATADLDPARALVVCLADAPDDRLREVHARLWRRRIPHLLAMRAGVMHALVPSTDDALDGVLAAVGAEGHVGVSGLLRSATRGAEAGREAVWALGAARQAGTRLHRFGEATSLTAPTSLAEAQSLVDEVLGPVLRHDAESHSDLLPTLESYLANRRSWQATADALHLHRQTVLYRIKRIEKLTGRSLAETETVAMMWLALRARRRLEGR
jgi:purine catabolism regulator